MTTLADWLDQETNRRAEGHHGRSDRAKLLVTFFAGISTTMTATALQVSPNTGALDRWATGLTGLALLLALVVIGRDQLCEADVEATLTEGLAAGLTQGELVASLRVAARTAVGFNEDLLREIQWVSLAQVTVSLAASVLAALSLMA